MEKISFIIPNSEKKEYTNITLPINGINEDENISVKKNNIILNSNINEYVNIAPNIYRFGINNFELENDIYSLYNMANQIKLENKKLAIQIFKKCQKLITYSTKNEIKYEIFINLALLVSETGGSNDEVDNFYKESLKIFSDRAEPYYYWSIYCNRTNKFEKSFELLNKALSLSYDDAVIKYPNTQYTAYGKFLFEELSIACSWLKKYNEAKILLEKMIDDPDFKERREKINSNLQIVNNKILNV